MPQPGDPSQPQPSAEESFLDLIAETVAGLEESVRGQFLRQFFRNIAQIDLSPIQSNELWQQVLDRHRELTERMARRISLRTAIVDVLSSSAYLRVPVLMEYGDFKKLQFNAASDALTGLYNRRLFDEYCDKELNRAKRYSHNLAVVILDLHKLKEVNDRYGHLQGDHALRLAGATLRGTLRASDFAFRIGGDEFALLLPQTDLEQAATLSHRLRAQYESEIQPLKLDIAVTLDFGVAVYPQDGDQKSDLIKIADKNLYELKYSNRAPSGVVPMAAQPEREAPTPSIPRRGFATAPGSGSAASPAPTHTPSTASAPAAYAVQRKWERVSLAKTKAHAILTDASRQTAKVIDLSYGGVALEFDSSEDLPAQFNAILHVPILPPVRVILRKAYVLKSASGPARIGCSFVA